MQTGFVTSFQLIASYFGRPSSQTVLFSGVPLDTPLPNFSQIENVSERIGLEVELHRNFPKKVEKSHLPAIVFTKNNQTIVLLEKLDDGTFNTSLSAHDQAKTLTTDELLSANPKSLLTFSAVYINSAIRKEAGLSEKVEKKNWLRSTLGAFWKSYTYVAIAALFINFIGLATPIFIMNVYDRILPNEAISSLWVLGIGIILALIFDLMLKSARASLIDHTGRVADQKLSYLIFEKVLSTKLSSKPASTGEFSSRVSQYEFVREFFTSNTLSTLIDTAFIFIFFGIIYLVAGWLVIIPILALIITVIVGLVAQQFIKSKVSRAANESAQRNALLIESIGAIENVKALRAESLLLRKWAELNKNASKTTESIKQISAGASNVTQFFQQLATVGIVIAGAYAFSSAQITTGGIIATVMLSGRALAPLGQIALTLSRLHHAVLSLRILNEIMDQPDEMPKTLGFVNREIKSGSIEAHSLEFAYPNSDHKVISDMSFKIKPGERVGIIGKIGSGKTTLGRLICNLYEPTGGRLLIDGVDVRQYHPHEVRKAVSFAGQTAELFLGTVKENLLVAKPEATDEEIIAVAKKTGVDDFVSRHPRGYDMPVGERGEQLSGGQKQAVILAQLLLTDPHIMYLDEPSGAMDLASERALIRTLSSSFDKDQTLLLSTHRFSMLELVNRIIVLENGRLVADGPKDLVMKQLAQRAAAAKVHATNTPGQ
ncbi:MAG: type I secretion system permease/ATPase [Rhizobiaceae bacterium]